ncbi:MAG: glutathione S-transferase [Deltaproteobacteria bacterium]|jgi:glutathione S-transferase|nr:glutathione S-transferase [Deltaproteobacteria bacterium]
MKFYNSIGPNPKLVRMFAAEKGFTFPETVDVDIMSGENRQDAYKAKNPGAQMPGLELDDGRFLAETIALCEYIEDLQAEPPLIGSNPEERAETRMWVRRIEERINWPLAAAFRNSEGLPLFKDRILTIPEAADGLKAVAQEGMRWLEEQIAGRDTIVPGRFTLADVALFSFTEFGAQVGQPIDAGLANLNAWFEATKARPSSQA